MSSLKVGIVGLPNVGKSTLFNALTKQAAAARNVPFTTIEPNVGVVPVLDDRLDKLTVISKSAKTTPTTIEFVDIAGLVRGAHQGEGLGNQFLANIREVDAIVQVARLFEDTDIIHVDNHLDPAADIVTVNTELALADLATVEKSLRREEKAAKGQNKEAIAKTNVFKRLHEHLSEGHPARTLPLDPDETELSKELHLLTIKPILYVANVSEASLNLTAEDAAKRLGLDSQAQIIILSIKIEQELTELSEDEQAIFLAEYGLKESGLQRLTKAAYQLLGLLTFFTSGPTESRAWTVRKGALAPEAAGAIHSDMQRGFIRAETIAYQDLLAAGSEAAARAAGKVRSEGKEYLVQDGDIMLFKFSV